MSWVVIHPQLSLIQLTYIIVNEGVLCFYSRLCFWFVTELSVVVMILLGYAGFGLCCYCFLLFADVLY